MFNRFRNQAVGKLPDQLSFFGTKDKQGIKVDINPVPSLSPVEKENRIQLIKMVNAELSIMLKGHSIWWYLLAMGVIVGSLFLPLEIIQGWFPLVMVLPIAIWSQMGTREKYYFTWEIIMSSCHPLYKYFAVWIAGILVTLLMSSGILINYLVEGQTLLILTWLVGIFSSRHWV